MRSDSRFGTTMPTNQCLHPGYRPSYDSGRQSLRQPWPAGPCVTEQVEAGPDGIAEQHQRQCAKPGLYRLEVGNRAAGAEREVVACSPDEIVSWSRQATLADDGPQRWRLSLYRGTIW